MPQTTKASPGDQTHTREVMGLEVNDSKHLTSEQQKVTFKC